MTAMRIALFPQVEGRRARPYLFLTGLQFFDVITTGIILANWSVRAEGNPIAAWFLGHGLILGLFMLLTFKLTTVFILWEKQTKVRLAGAIYTAVAFNNLLFMYLWLIG